MLGLASAKFHQFTHSHITMKKLRFLSWWLITSFFLVACSEPEELQESVRPVMVVTPSLSGISNQVFPGEVRARLEPELSFRIGGKLVERLVDSGQRVTKDQVLAVLDPEDVELQLQAAKAGLAAAQANLELLKAELGRYEQLQQKQLVSRSHYDNAKTQYRNGQAQLEQAKAQLDVAKNQTAYTKLRAPANGVIARSLVEGGQVLAAGQAAFVLAVDGEPEVAFNIPEHQIDEFKLGQQVEVSLWSQPDLRLQGQIRELEPTADPRSRTYAARVAFASGTAGVELGQSARVHVARDSNISLLIPLGALTSEQGKPFVYVYQPQTQQVQRRWVKTGSYSQTSAIILEGLQVDDLVVAAGVHLLQDGQMIRAVDRDNSPVGQP